ncbi:DUF6745 domain-containing protein [Streptomyces brevispora]|uniref:DUF6745 domain-containing protein n=1 Tax=Streptomyces brevispora TaxID=887462 RepID=A0A561V670_9ACTN|nr:hypothetical protein [Streptomyces brevispora]TWG07112.1 hypothetical protein FHX80_115615 [Streptomyces brevispora]WSC12049.1 hypothetical protein OIE64_03780 [Streptomyces brevispora]
MEYVDSWRAVAAATGAADRSAAEDGVRLAYRSAGLAEPEEFVWADSPRAAVGLVRKLNDAGRSVREEVRTRPWAEERRRMYDELGPAGWSALWSATGAQLWETTAALAERIRAGVVAERTEPGELAERGEPPEGEAEVLQPEDESEIRLLLLDAVLGQHDAAWLAAFDGRGDRLDGLAAVARNAGWWWPYERTVVISERPEALHRDEAGRLDRGDGPALSYRDGFALYAWRGMPVPADFLAELTALTPERIRAEENAELRRVMLEFYGYDRYLTESGAEPVHRDETGILWRIALDGDEDVVMVEVVNSTPEPDGTYRTYWLRVPPTTRTAKDGVAWTFGLQGESYAPVRQT